MSYLFGYMMGLEARRPPRRETLGHRATLFRERVLRYIKNWRYHLLRERKPLSPEAVDAIQEMARGFDDGLAGRIDVGARVVS